MRAIAFFPWLRIKEATRVDRYALVPFERQRLPGGQFQTTLDLVLAPYRVGTRPVPHATILQLGDRLHDELTEDDRRDAFSFAELVALAGLSARTYFGPAGYVNRDYFTFIIQSFEDPAKGVSILTRRRDRGTMTGFPPGVYQIRRPEHVFPGEVVKLDIPLLHALVAARALDTWYLFEEGIFFFDRANTDSDQVAEESELIATVSAFERLLDCGRGREEELVARFFQVWMTHACLLSSECPNRIESSTQMSVTEAWLRDMFRARGELGHGKRNTNRPQRWSLREHLMLGSHIFPLLVKSRLYQHSLYSPTEQDIFEINIFEHLACAKIFEPRRKRGIEAWPWNEIRSLAKFERYWERQGNSE